MLVLYQLPAGGSLDAEVVRLALALLVRVAECGHSVLFGIRRDLRHQLVGDGLSPACFNSDSISKATRLSYADTKTTDFLNRYSSSEKPNKLNYK